MTNETPLKGIKVLDFTQALLGALCTQMLGDFGADVIKVEPLEGDLTRISAQEGDSVVFLCANRSKRSLAVNLKDPEGKELVLKLAGKADVIAENFRPGVMKKLGLDYETISRTNPRVVYQTLYMYGETGPLAHRRGADPWAQAFTGVVAGQGDPNGPPYLAGHGFMDIGGALIGVAGIITALFVRERTGLGQEVTTNLVNAGVFMQSSTFGYSLIDGVLLKKGGRGTARGQFPYGAYTAKDGDVVTIFGQDDAEWPVFCSILGIEHLLRDPRYDTQGKRIERKFELYPILDDAFRKRTRAEWEQLFRKQGLRCDPCLDYFELIEHPQFKANDIVVEVDHPGRGRIKTIGPPMKFKGMPPLKPQKHPPILGEHTREILLELGYEEEEIARLHHQGAIGIPSPDMLKVAPKKGPVVSVDLDKMFERRAKRSR